MPNYVSRDALAIGNAPLRTDRNVLTVLEASRQMCLKKGMALDGVAGQLRKGISKITRPKAAVAAYRISRQIHRAAELQNKSAAAMYKAAKIFDEAFPPKTKRKSTGAVQLTR